MSTEVVTINLNGFDRKVDKADHISYEKLCKLTSNPIEFNPTVTWSTGPHRTGQIVAGEEAPLREGAVYNVWITGNG